MRALVQRVASAQVQVDGKVIAQIEAGVLVFVCAMRGDTPKNAQSISNKISKLRIFPDSQGRMNLSLLDTGGAALIVSQFTLAADTSRGNRPGFSLAMPPAEGKHLYELVAQSFEGLGIPTATGEFGADMQVSLVNDGPVTIWIDH